MSHELTLGTHGLFSNHLLNQRIKTKYRMDICKFLKANFLIIFASVYALLQSTLVSSHPEFCFLRFQLSGLSHSLEIVDGKIPATSNV